MSIGPTVWATLLSRAKALRQRGGTTRVVSLAWLKAARRSPLRRNTPPHCRKGVGESRGLDRLLEGVIEVAAAVEQPGGLNCRERRGTHRHEPSLNGRRGRVFRPGPMAQALLTLWPLIPRGGHPSPLARVKGEDASCPNWAEAGSVVGLALRHNKYRIASACTIRRVCMMHVYAAYDRIAAYAIGYELVSR